MPDSPPSIEIRPATVDDVALILRFIRELAACERAEQEVVATEASLRATLFGEGARARALVCRVAGVDAGLCVYFFNYSMDEWVRYRLAGEALAAFAQGKEPGIPG